MSSSSRVLLKRRKQGVNGSGPPNALLNGELAYNENDQVLYYGSGDDGNGNSTNIVPIAGNFTTLLKDSTVQTLTSTLVESNQCLIINLSGTTKVIKLFDILS